MKAYLNMERMKQFKNLYPDKEATHIVVCIEYGSDNIFLLSEPRKKKMKSKATFSSLPVRIRELVSKIQIGRVSEFTSRPCDHETTCDHFGDWSSPAPIESMANAVNLIQVNALSNWTIIVSSSNVH
jgi:hypothetical protein